MDFKYVRIQGREIASTTQYAAGVFSMCWKLVKDKVMDPEDAALFVEIDTWFSEQALTSLSWTFPSWRT